MLHVLSKKSLSVSNYKQQPVGNGSTIFTMINKLVFFLFFSSLHFFFFIISISGKKKYARKSYENALSLLYQNILVQEKDLHDLEVYAFR